VVIELSEAYAPAHVANIRALVREQYFDGLAILRSQDNFVVQWGDPDEKNPRPMKQGKKSLAPEFTRSIDPKLPFTRLPDVDGYAPEVGFSNSFPVAAIPNQPDRSRTVTAWSAPAATTPTPGNGAELYVVTGHAPRQLDRNITCSAAWCRACRCCRLPRGPR
jgi:peptidylprolyl isomerase